MADGAARFGQGSSDPALLRVQAWLADVPRTGLSPSPARLSRRLPLRLLLPSRLPYNPGRASTPPVWAGPLSLAATRGVTLVFLSSDYLDVSVRRVRLRNPADAAPCARRVAPFGHPRISGCSRLPAVFRGLPRPSSPPGASGIPRAPSLACRSRVSRRASPRASLVCLRAAPHGARVLCVFLSSHPVKEPCGGRSPRLSGECGARTHDPRLAKPVL